MRIVLSYTVTEILIKNRPLYLIDEGPVTKLTAVLRFKLIFLYPHLLKRLKKRQAHLT